MGVLTKQEIVWGLELMIERQVVVLLLDFDDFVEEVLLVLPGFIVFNGSEISEFYCVHGLVFFMRMNVM